MELAGTHLDELLSRKIATHRWTEPSPPLAQTLGHQTSEWTPPCHQLPVAMVPVTRYLDNLVTGS